MVLIVCYPITSNGTNVDNYLTISTDNGIFSQQSCRIIIILRKLDAMLFSKSMHPFPEKHVPFPQKACMPRRETMSYPQSYIIFLFIFNFKFKYDEYNILLKQFIHLCYNICSGSY